MIKNILFAIKNLRASHEDAKLNRRLAGSDRYGNKYYQYYNEKGKETRRILEANPHASETFDPIWSEWLCNRQKTPFNEKELKSFYDVQEMNKKNAFDYEIKDAKMMDEFRKEYIQKQETVKSTKPIGIGAEYNPGIWKPNSIINNSNQNEKKN